MRNVKSPRFTSEGNASTKCTHRRQGGLWEYLEELGRSYSDEENTIDQPGKESEESVEAFPVYLSNPICPCCKAPLIIVDDTDEGDTEELAEPENLKSDPEYAPSKSMHDSGLLEFFTHTSEHVRKISKMYSDSVKELFEELIQSYHDLGMDQFEIVDAIRRKSNDAIYLKAVELKSLLLNELNLDLDIDEIKLDLQNRLIHKLDYLNN